MRYLSLLFFVFLSLCSEFVFANEFPHPEDCIQVNFYGGPQATVNAVRSGCLSNSSVNLIKSFSISGTPYVRCLSCINPCFEGQIYDSATKTCITPPPDPSENPEECSESEKVYDPISGSMVCPGFGDGSGSSSSTSSFCLVPGDHDGDCIPDDQQGSSSPDTGSSGSAGSAASTPSGGDDGDGTPGGGGGDGGDGGENGGGGSASSASGSGTSSGSNNSWNPYSGYGNWIPVPENSTCRNKYQDMSGQWWCAGGSNDSPTSSGSAASTAPTANECDNTSSDYFSCINQKSVGGGAGWNPRQSYGGWLPISEDSPCVNKYQDAYGDWWCAAPSGGGGGGGGGGTPASSAGSSGSSGSSGSEGEGSASSASSISSSSSSCSAASVPNGSSASNPCSGGGNGSASSSGSLSSLGEKGEFDGEDSGKRLEELEEELANKIDDIKQDIKNEFTSAIRGTGTIEDFCKDIRGKEVCFGMKKFEEWLDPISTAIFLVACVISFSIVLSGRN